ncbi:MAG: tRNA (N(6)-L-threonylcarbamoyladenosine(37)-C(2))-methylthiotransferase MtaB [Planctomycetota bacterium]|nr:tRNA (N(6)-L-threonylcarbamoyladenosine(37)-C(2))-methylthiotransferase MtaB [Planctomycetota bacterium]
MLSGAFSIGCKTNQYETELLKEALSAVEKEVILLNTCAVTAEAEHKSLKTLRSILRKFPTATVIVTGCMVGYKPNKFKHPRIIAIPNEQKEKIPEMFEVQPLEFINSFSEHSRAFVKVADGCPHGCSYCIVRHLRGSLRSRTIHSILEEAHFLSEKGYKEIVLTAVNLSAYGRDIGTDLATLVKSLDSSSLFPRIRLSSLEMHFMDERLLSVLASCQHLCPHFHIPLQSGSDKILARMNRPYSAEKFLAVVERLKRAFDRPAFTTDIIVGFPGETEKEFEETLSVARDARFCRIHIFPFSPRDGTEAATFPERLPKSLVRDRLKRLKELADSLSEEYRRSLVGIKETVIVEKSGCETIGLIERYQKVKVENLSGKRGEYLPVEVQALCNSTLVAVCI